MQLLHYNCIYYENFFMTRLIVLTFLFFSALISTSQESKILLIGAEAGFISSMNELNNNERIRGYVSYPQGYYASSIISASDKLFFGFKGESILGENAHWGIASGLRYSRISNVVCDNSLHYNSIGYFYWKYNEFEDKTEYLKIENIYQNSHYMGIPVELKYFISVPVKLRLYLKVGTEFNLLLVSRNQIDFKNPAMNKYETIVSDQIADAGKIDIELYGAGGLKYGNDDNLSVSLELVAPSFSLISSDEALVKSFAGAGFQITVQYPLNKLAK